MGDTNEVSPEHAEKIAAKMIAADLGAGKRSVIFFKKEAALFDISHTGSRSVSSSKVGAEMNRVIAAFFPLVSQTISFICLCIYIYDYICIYQNVCVCGERLTSGTHKDHPGLHTFSMSHQPLFALQAEKRLDGFIDQKSGVIHFEGGMSLEYFSQGLWGCMFQFCI